MADPKLPDMPPEEEDPLVPIGRVHELDLNEILPDLDLNPFGVSLIGKDGRKYKTRKEMEEATMGYGGEE